MIDFIDRYRISIGAWFGYTCGIFFAPENVPLSHELLGSAVFLAVVILVGLLFGRR